VEIKDMSNQPVTGVEVRGFKTFVTMVFNASPASSQVNSEGRSEEFFFPDGNGTPKRLEIIKSGYKIASATGCTPEIFNHS
jgi:hypothetical protein